MTKPHLLTTKQAAEYLGLSAETLHEWRQLAKGPPYYRLGRKISYGRSDLDKWLASNRVVGGGK